MKHFFSYFCLALSICFHGIIFAAAKSKVPVYKPDFGSKRFNIIMNQEDAEILQEKLKIPGDVRGIRYRGQCLISPLGQLGGFAVSTKEIKGLTLYELDPSGRLCKAGLKDWDLITEVNKIPLGSLPAGRTNTEGPIVTFGNELNKVERSGGKIFLKVIRKGKAKFVKVPVAARGDFMGSPNSPKSRALLDLSLKILEKCRNKDNYWPCGYGTNYTTYQACLAYLAANDPKYAKLLKESVYKALDLKNEGWTWSVAMKTILTAEYFWATGDMKVYEKLQSLTDKLATYMNPLGGLSHNKLGASYELTNFGGPSTLTQLAMALAEKCGIAVDLKQINLGLKNFYSKEGGNAAGYGGGLYNCQKEDGSRRIGESGFVTSVLGLALHLRSDYKPEITADVVKTISMTHQQLRFIHSTPSQGMFFGSLLLAKAAPKAFMEHFRYRTWSLTLAHLPDNNIYYTCPIYARMAIPGGGGWGGDSILGFQHMACIENIILLTAHKQRLMITGNKKPGWLSKKSSKQFFNDIRNFHRERLKSHTAAMKNSFSLKNYSKAYENLLYLEDYYLPTPYLSPSSFASLRKMFKKRSIWKKVKKATMEREEEKFFRWASNFKGVKWLNEFFKRYPKSALTEKVKAKITEKQQAKSESESAH